MEIRMPKLDQDMTSAVLTEWLFNVGDEVKEGQGVARIDTDKVETEIESPVAGTVRSLLVAEGEVCAVGSIIMTIEESIESASEPLVDA